VTEFVVICDNVQHTRELLDQGLCAQAASQQLCELATRLGTSDNVTVIVIELQHKPRTAG
jgi:serine/threonine protein phosphatase PrpC